MAKKKAQNTFHIKHLLIGAAALVVVLFGLTIIPAFGASTTHVVLPSDLATSFPDLTTKPDAWFFYNDENDTIDNTLGSFVAGPAVPPVGLDSVQISVSGTQRRNLATYQFRNTRLADITELKFSTYNPSAGNGGSANRSGYLNFNVTFDGADTWQRRLVYVPSKNGTVLQDTWQEWDAIGTGSALWSWSGYVANGNKWPDNNTTEYRTWSDLIASFPNIAIRATDSWLGIRVGEPYADGYTENIDAFKFGVNGDTQVFNFEQAPVAPVGPGNKDACKKNGWQTFVSFFFKNQGDCVSYVQSNEKAVGNKNK